MIANKHLSKIIIVITAIAVILCFLAIIFSDKLNTALGGTGVSMEYESKLFDTGEVMSVDIQMDEDEWNAMLENPLSEEYYACNVVINGKRVNNVAIRPKGNTSLSAIAMDPDSNRYSLKLEFDHFVDGQTCYGLDKLILNNNYADATNMKEALIYDMYQFIGAEASLYNYAKVSVNGAYFGVYLALEAVEESFMLRNFGTQDGELYKPDSMEMGGGNAGDGNSSGGGFGGTTPPSNGKSNETSDDKSSDAGTDSNSSKDSSDSNSTDNSAEKQTPPSDSGNGNMTPPSGDGNFTPPSGDGNMTPPSGDGNFTPPSGDGNGGFSFDPNNMPDMSNFDPNNMPDMSNIDTSNMPDMGNFSPSDMGGFSMGGNGANLNYTDDELDSYSTIWEGEITGTSKADHRRVVTALKNISEGNDLETYLDVDNVLKYMAVHVFSVNMDSLSGSMAHNYYLYEYEGQLNIFPWDYNLSFGGMSMGSSGDATGMVNDAIDTPFAGTKFFDALLSNEEYKERYHQYLQQLVDEYINGGRFEETYTRIRSQIDELVKDDPTAFYTYEEYQTAADMLYETVLLRGKSIEGQLNGTIPSTDAEQKKDSSSLIDASKIDVKAMGEFNMGGNYSAGGGVGRSSSGSGGNSQPSTGGAGDTQPPAGGGGNSQSSAGGGGNAKPSASGGSGNKPSGMPDMSAISGLSAGQGSRTETYIIYGACFVLMIAALVVVLCIRRKK